MCRKTPWSLVVASPQSALDDFSVIFLRISGILLSTYIEKRRNNKSALFQIVVIVSFTYPQKSLVMGDNTQVRYLFLKFLVNEF